MLRRIHKATHDQSNEISMGAHLGRASIRGCEGQVNMATTAPTVTSRYGLSGEAVTPPAMRGGKEGMYWGREKS